MLVAVVNGDENALFIAPGVPGLRHQRAAAGAAIVFVQ